MKEVEQYYDIDPEVEWSRLDRHRMEFALSMCALSEFLPEPTAKILDVGGGPGRYAIPLAQQGYEVDLLDLSNGNLVLAKQKAELDDVRLAGYHHGNALDLSQFPSETYAAVILMGPLYHLLSEEERLKAITEAKRVLKPGGCLFASFITIYAAFRRMAKVNPTLLAADQDAFEGVLKTGINIEKYGFTKAYFAHPSEVKPMMENVGFETLGLMSCEGLVSELEEKVNELSGSDWDRWVELNYRVSFDPYLLGASGHMLYIGKKTL